ncbi:MAG: hypothetical protein U1A27_04860 [Phycisphaerae bacterium]
MNGTAGAMPWQMVGAIVATVSALVGPLVVVVLFYVRGVRDDQRVGQEELSRRAERLEAEQGRVAAAVEGVQQAYTTKDEWLRETMLARQQLERLGEQLARMQADMEHVRGLANQLGRATNAIVELADHLAGRG